MHILERRLESESVMNHMRKIVIVDLEVIGTLSKNKLLHDFASSFAATVAP